MARNLTPIDTDVDSRIEMIDRSRWSADLDIGLIHALARYTEAVRLPAGGQLFREGERGGDMLLVVEGRLDVHKDGARGKVTKVASIRSGQSIGEMSLLDKAPRSATVVAETDTMLLILTRTSFEHMCATEPEAALQLVIALARRLSQHLRRTSVALADGPFRR